MIARLSFVRSYCVVNYLRYFYIVNKVQLFSLQICDVLFLVLCNRTLNWIVRVTYTTLGGHVAHMDSVRLCMADAARLRGQYDAHKAVICRVYPLRAS